MNKTTDTIKDRLSIVDVVGSYVQLASRGNAFVARCPFHNEKTPSFYVSPDRGTYHCFGCGKGGDIFSFVQDFEGVDFREALQTLATRAGVEIEKYDKQQAQETSDTRERLFKIIDETKKIYIDSFDAESKDYVNSRGLNSQTLKTFSIGYAKNEWRFLTTTLKQRGYTDQELILAGLSIPTEKGLYDKFRGRLMFPITNMQGRVVGFSGRILPKYAVNSSGNEAPKYMNSPETDLYHKSSVLFGYDIARDAIRKTGRVVIVEGNMDVLMSHQAGIYETVAVSGTALTADHAKILSRLAHKVYVCFDSDQAGINALFKTVPLLIANDLDIYIIDLPEGKKDPADVVFESDKAWVDMVNSAPPLIDFLVSYAKRTHINQKDLRTFSDTHIMPIIAGIPSVMNRAHAINVLSRAIDLPEETLYAALLEKQNRATPPPEKNVAYTKQPTGTEIFVGLWNLRKPEFTEIIQKIFTEFLGEDPEKILSNTETDSHTFESFAERGLDDANDKYHYVRELALAFIKNHIESKLREIKNSEDQLQNVVEYIKKLDLINRQHHTNNYE